MKKSVLLAVLIGVAFSQTVSSVSGFDWMEWHSYTKLGYASGFFSGMNGYKSAVDEAESTQKERNSYWLTPLVVDITRANADEYSSFLNALSVEEIVKRVDGFYTDPDNSGIQLVDAFRVINLRADGNSERADRLLIQFQREYLKGK